MKKPLTDEQKEAKDRQVKIDAWKSEFFSGVHKDDFTPDEVFSLLVDAGIEYPL